MEIGIVVYSYTGHTLSVAEALQQRLSADGHAITLERLETCAPLRMSDTTIQLKAAPAVDAYDALVFACPVRGGTPASPMRVYLEGIPSLVGKDVACLVTGVLPAGWGRNQALAQMRELCQSKGAEIYGSASVWWWSLRRKRQIAEALDRLRSLF
jgi:flavodoxin